MSKYSYLNLNQKMIKIRKKIPSLMRKRYSEDVDYDFVKLDDINQFLTPALNRYGVDFDILREIPTQITASGTPMFLIQDGNLWRYEADLEICWTNADHPEEKIISVLHLVGTNDVADKAKGTAMTYGLKYYLLNKFNIPQNGDEDPDMKRMKPAQEQQAKLGSEKKKDPKKADPEETKSGRDTGFVPSESLEEGLNALPDHSFSKRTGEKPARNGNAVTSRKAEKEEPQQISFLEEPEGRTFVIEKEQEMVPAGAEEAEPRPEETAEEDIDFSAEEESEETGSMSAEEEDNGFQAVTEEDQVPFPEQEKDAGTADDELEKAKSVICNFGLYKGKTLGEMLETPKGWESLKWISMRYGGANKEMKEAAKVLVDAEAYISKAA